MTTYTWSRGKGGASAAGGTTAVLMHSLATYHSSTGITVRRSVIDWGIDLIANSDTGALNSDAQITLGLIVTTSSTTTPNPPTGGPGSSPGADWVWWEGAWAASTYSTPFGSSSGAFSANGRIDKRNYMDMSKTEYSTWYLVAEIDNSAGGWTTFKMIGWWNQLSAPTVG